MYVYMYIPGDNLVGWLLVDVLAFKKNRFQKTRLASCLFRSVIFNRTYFIYSAQRHIQFVRLRRLLGGVGCGPCQVHLPFFAGTQFAVGSCVLAADSTRLMRTKNRCIARWARMAVSARCHLSIANAKLIATHRSVVDLASQQSATDRAAAKRACVQSAFIFGRYCFISCRRWITQRCSASRAPRGVVCAEAFLVCC